MSDTLSRICADKRREVARRKASRPEAELATLAGAAAPPRGFRRRLEAALAEGRYGLIAENKKASPSKGLIRADFDPAALASAYERGGASCLSVLTDGPYFQGRDEDLVAARAATALPVLRKDFTLEPYQVAEARALGADCLLLILAALDDGAAAEIEAAAEAWGMDVLIEVHDRAELERAARLSSPLLGINNRDLKTMEVDLATTESLAASLPPGRLAVSESGLGAPEDLERMRRAGVGCFLVGESLMRAGDVAAATAALIAPPAGQVMRA